MADFDDTTRSKYNDESGGRKRRFSGDDKTDQKKAKKRLSPEDAVIKLLMPTGVAGAVIGKGGASITEMTDRFKIQFQMSKPREYFPETEERVVVFAGPPDGVLEGVDYLVRHVAEKEDLRHPKDSYDYKDNPRHFSSKFVIALQVAGGIIGRGGKNAKNFKDDFGAVLEVSPQIELYQERVVTICGKTFDEILAASREMARRIIAEGTHLMHSSFFIHYDKERNRDSADMDRGRRDRRSDSDYFFSANELPGSWPSNMYDQPRSIGGGMDIGPNRFVEPIPMENSLWQAQQAALAQETRLVEQNMNLPLALSESILPPPRELIGLDEDRLGTTTHERLLQNLAHTFRSVGYSHSVVADLMSAVRTMAKFNALTLLHGFLSGYSTAQLSDYHKPVPPPLSVIEDRSSAPHQRSLEVNPAAYNGGLSGFLSNQEKTRSEASPRQTFDMMGDRIFGGNVRQPSTNQSIQPQQKSAQNDGPFNTQLSSFLKSLNSSDQQQQNKNINMQRQDDNGGQFTRPQDPALFASNSFDRDRREGGGSGGGYDYDGGYGSEQRDRDRMGSNQSGGGQQQGRMSMGQRSGQASDNKGIEFEVPDQLIGVIMGQGGQTLLDLERASGAKISISQKGIYAPGTKNRLIKIEGNADSTALALRMVETGIKNEKHRLNM